MKLLLDTCVFLWMAQQPGKISAMASRSMDDSSNKLLVSDVSILEVVVKHSAGKLPLPKNPSEWIPEKIAYHQLTRIPLKLDVIFRSGDAPRVHFDPFDRLLAAVAVEDGLTVVSPDRPISDLGASRIW